MAGDQVFGEAGIAGRVDAPHAGLVRLDSDGVDPHAIFEEAQLLQPFKRLIMADRQGGARAEFRIGLLLPMCGAVCTTI